MKTLLSVVLLAAIALTLAAPAFAAQPTQADFDACNRAAQAAGSSPSASPQGGGAASPQAGGAASPQAGATTSPGVTTGPSATTSAGTPDSTSGVQQGGGAGKTGPMVTGSGRQPGSTGGVREGTGAVTKDSAGAPQTGASSAQVTGMADRGMTDNAYKTAYQDCMKQRGF